MLTTTYRLAKDAGACAEMLRKARRAFGPVRACGIDKPVPLTEVLDRLGLDAAVWCLRCVEPGQEDERLRVAVLFACGCADRVLPLFEDTFPKDPRPQEALKVARRFAGGRTGKEPLRWAYSRVRDVDKGGLWEKSSDPARLARDAVMACAYAWEADPWTVAESASRDARSAAAIIALGGKYCPEKWKAGRDAEEAAQAKILSRILKSRKN